MIFARLDAERLQRSRTRRFDAEPVDASAEIRGEVGRTPGHFYDLPIRAVECREVFRRHSLHGDDPEIGWCRKQRLAGRCLFGLLRFRALACDLHHVALWSSSEAEDEMPQREVPVVCVEEAEWPSNGPRLARVVRDRMR